LDASAVCELPAALLESLVVLVDLVVAARVWEVAFAGYGEEGAVGMLRRSKRRRGDTIMSRLWLVLGDVSMAEGS
jgi:hypothetical protein